MKSGLYTSASEVVREALRRLREQDEWKQVRREELRAAVRVGLEAADRGELHATTDAWFDDVVAERRRRIAARASR